MQFHVNNFPIEYKISRPANNVAGYIIVLMVAISFATGAFRRTSQCRSV